MLTYGMGYGMGSVVNAKFGFSLLQVAANSLLTEFEETRDLSLWWPIESWRSTASSRAVSAAPLPIRPTCGPISLCKRMAANVAPMKSTIRASSERRLDSTRGDQYVTTQRPPTGPGPNHQTNASRRKTSASSSRSCICTSVTRSGFGLASAAAYSANPPWRAGCRSLSNTGVYSGASCDAGAISPNRGPRRPWLFLSAHLCRDLAYERWSPTALPHQSRHAPHHSEGRLSA